MYSIAMRISEPFITLPTCLSVIWRDTPGTLVGGTGNGAAQSLTVYGRVPITERKASRHLSRHYYRNRDLLNHER